MNVDTYSEAELHRMKADDLRSICANLQSDADGTKRVMVKRIMESQTAPPASANMKRPSEQAISEADKLTRLEEIKKSPKRGTPAGSNLMGLRLSPLTLVVAIASIKLRTIYFWPVGGRPTLLFVLVALVSLS